jgi:transcriptional regulator with XRE-family HTH domain
MKPKSRPPSARQVLAMNLRRLRHAREWSQEDLALEAGLHRTFVAHVERTVRNISIDNIEKLAMALGVEITDLLADLPEQTKPDEVKKGGSHPT